MYGGWRAGRRPHAVATIEASRADRSGAALSLLHRRPEQPAVLLYGRRGMGTSFQLDQFAAATATQGWRVLRVDASPTDPIELRFSRAVKRLIPDVRREHGRRAANELKEVMRGLALRLETEHKAHEGRVSTPSFNGVVPSFSYAVRSGKDSIGGDPGSTLADLAETLDRLGKPVLLAVDNVADAADIDLAHLNDLARHLGRSRMQVNLVMAGGPESVNRLESAAREYAGGVRSNIRGLYDIRECLPVPPQLMDQMMRSDLAYRGVPYTREAGPVLVGNSYGIPQRMRMLVAAAAEFARPPQGIDAGAATAAIRRVNDRMTPYYESDWMHSSTAEQFLMSQAAISGRRGESVDSVMRNTPWPLRGEVTGAFETLINRGVLTREGQRFGMVQYADPGMAEWVQMYGGRSAAYLGVPPLSSVQAAQPVGQAGPRNPVGGGAQQAGAARTAAAGPRVRLPRDLGGRMPGAPPDQHGHFSPGQGY